MLSNPPSATLHPKSTWLTAVLCLFAVWSPAGDATAQPTLSRGRQVLLNRGLQVQAFTYYNQFTDMDQWVSANFTTFNLLQAVLPQPAGWMPGDPDPMDELALLPADKQWGMAYDAQAGFEHTKALQDWQLPYADRLVSFQYRDEINAGILDPAVLADAKATYTQWRADYGDILAYTNFSSGITTPQIQQYMDATHPDMLMFDNYPLYSPSATAGDPVAAQAASMMGWYSSMAQYRDLALTGYNIDGVNTGPIPYAQYLKLHRNNDDSERWANESFFRLQQNASWAFGYTFTTGFVYEGYGLESLMFDAGNDTNPQAGFSYVAEANRQSQNLGPALIRLVSSSISMVNGTTEGLRPANVSPWVAGLGGDNYMTAVTPWDTALDVADASYSDVLIGHFNPLLASNPNDTVIDGSPNGKLFMIVNGATGDTSAALEETYRINFNFGVSGVDQLVRIDRDTGLPVLVDLISDGGSLYHYDLPLGGGTGDLFAYRNSSDLLPTLDGRGVLGDFNADGIINTADSDIMKANWFTTGNALNQNGEVTGDGVVNIDDFSLFKETLFTGPASALALSVPEPNSLVMLLAFVPAWLICRSRRNVV